MTLEAIPTPTPVVPPAPSDPILIALERLAAIDLSFPEMLNVPGLAEERRYASARLGDWKTLRDVLPIALQLARRGHECEAELKKARRNFDTLSKKLEKRLDDLARELDKSAGAIDGIGNA